MKSTHSLRRIITAAVLAASLAAPVAAQPRIAAVDGKFADGEMLSIKGEDFGVKNPAKPILWADFSKAFNPSPLGRVTSWSKVQNMEWGPSGRVFGKNAARASNGSGTWTMRVDHDAWTKDGQKIYVFKHQRMNFLITDESQNWKSWRMWPSDGSRPNIYASPSNGRVFVEYCGEQETGFWGSFRRNTTDWYAEELLAKASSAMNSKDGILIIRHNGVEKASGSIMTRSSEAPAYMTQNYVVHEVGANYENFQPGWNDTNRLWVDDVYADNSWARVMIGNEPSASYASKWEIQVPAEWSDKEVKIHVNAGEYPPGAQAFLYVYDAYGTPSAGFPITVAGEKRRERTLGDLDRPKQKQQEN